MINTTQSNVTPKPVTPLEAILKVLDLLPAPTDLEEQDAAAAGFLKRLHAAISIWHLQQFLESLHRSGQRTPATSVPKQCCPLGRSAKRWGNSVLVHSPDGRVQCRVKLQNIKSAGDIIRVLVQNRWMTPRARMEIFEGIGKAVHGHFGLCLACLDNQKLDWSTGRVIGGQIGALPEEQGEDMGEVGVGQEQHAGTSRRSHIDTHNRVGEERMQKRKKRLKARQKDQGTHDLLVEAMDAVLGNFKIPRGAAFMLGIPREARRRKTVPVN
ncbi:MAG: hypothetical protein ABSE73_01950 [Planctomycetota bacterium]